MILRPLILMLLFGVTAGAETFQANWPGVDGRGIFTDVHSRCTEQERRNAYEPDRVTYCHEMTQQLNSRVRNSFSSQVNAHYLGGGLFAVFPEPRVTLTIVARFVSAEYRNSTFQTYLLDSRQWWDHQPLFLIDEWSAFYNGTLAAVQLRVNPHGSQDRMMWFCHYADCLIAAVRQHDPNYSHLTELTQFVEWNKQRCQDLRQRV